MRSLPLVLLALLVLSACSGVVVKQGDTVSVTYTGAYENGTIFDSNDPAHQSDLPQKPAAAFAPMTVTVGQGKLIPGFERALVGMKEGQEQTVTIKATDAYGPYKAELVRTIPKIIYYNRTTQLRRTIDIPLSVLTVQLTNPPQVGQTFDTQNFRYNITKIGAVNATLYVLEVRNATITLETDPWPSEVIETTPDLFVLRRVPQNKGVVSTPQGPYVVHVEDDLIRLETALQMGQTFQSNVGIGRVTRETQNSLTLDLNHPLAGQTLVFTIRIDTVEPKK